MRHVHPIYTSVHIAQWGFTAPLQDDDDDDDAAAAAAAGGMRQDAPPKRQDQQQNNNTITKQTTKTEPQNVPFFVPFHSLGTYQCHFVLCSFRVWCRFSIRTFSLSLIRRNKSRGRNGERAYPFLCRGRRVRGLSS
jgi:hypothetical protein